MKYIVLMNRNYMNSFRYYTQARKFADDLRSRYKGNIIEIKEIR